MVLLGAVAQLGERLVRIEEVSGSNPLSSISLEGSVTFPSHRERDSAAS